MSKKSPPKRKAVNKVSKSVDTSQRFLSSLEKMLLATASKNACQYQHPPRKTCWVNERGFARRAAPETFAYNERIMRAISLLSAVAAAAAWSLGSRTPFLGFNTWNAFCELFNQSHHRRVGAGQRYPLGPHRGSPVELGIGRISTRDTDAVPL